MDIFAYNLQNYTHHTKLNTAKSNTLGGYQPTLFNNNTSAPIPQNNLMDFDAIKLGNNSGGFPNNI